MAATVGERSSLLGLYDTAKHDTFKVAAELRFAPELLPDEHVLLQWRRQARFLRLLPVGFDQLVLTNKQLWSVRVRGADFLCLEVLRAMTVEIGNVCVHDAAASCAFERAVTWLELLKALTLSLSCYSFVLPLIGYFIPFKSWTWAASLGAFASAVGFFCLMLVRIDKPDGPRTRTRTRLAAAAAAADDGGGDDGGYAQLLLMWDRSHMVLVTAQDEQQLVAEVESRPTALAICHAIREYQRSRMLDVRTREEALLSASQEQQQQQQQHLLYRSMARHSDETSTPR